MSVGPVSSTRHSRSTVPSKDSAGAGTPVPSVRRVVQAIVAMLHVDPTLTGDQLSATLGLSGGRLSRLFKRDMGISIVAYRNRLRFERFFALVGPEKTDRPSLRRAAREAGFGSYAQFHRLFRAHWRTSPREAIQGAIRKLGGPAVPSPVRTIVERGGHVSPEAVGTWLDRGDQRIMARLGGGSSHKIGGA